MSVDLQLTTHYSKAAFKLSAVSTTCVRTLLPQKVGAKFAVTETLNEICTPAY